MFKRKDEDIDLLSEAGGSMTADTTEKNEPKMTPAAPATQPTEATTPAQPPAAAPTATTPAAAPAATPAAAPVATPAAPTPADASRVARPASFRPGGEAPRTAGRPGTDYRPAGAGSTMSAGSSSTEKAKASGRRVLTVGHDILLKGEIATCDRLVIEGAVDATLNEVHTVEIAETGSFKGGAEIEDAEISGEFDGELTVRGRLVIYSTGKVRGKITYGEIEIERGGEMTGTIKSFKGEKASPKKDSEKADNKKEKIKEAA